MPYIICVEVGEDGAAAGGGGSKGLAERAYHPDELRGNARLAVDTEYYLAHQARRAQTRRPPSANTNTLPAQRQNKCAARPSANVSGVSWTAF